MDCASRKALVVEANELGKRNGYPWLDVASDPLTIALWLQRADPNGCHLPHLAIAEDFDPYTEETAWEALSDMLAGFR